jgi:sirohydrochlorin cobaltochelatase
MTSETSFNASAPADVNRLLECLTRAGEFTIGQIRVRPGFELIHILDSSAENLEVFTSAEDALQIALYDADRKFRPLKSAPNLRRGWLLRVTSIPELRLALDHFYPAALGLWVSFIHGRLPVTSWRETVGRQTGMYRIVGKITDDQSRELVASVCNQDSGCIRSILWPLAEGQPGPRTVEAAEILKGGCTPKSLPILCREACNLLVAAGRKVVKSSSPPPSV